MNKLTALKVQKTTKPGRHADGGNLYLTVSKSGAKSWIFMWKSDGRTREMGLGSLNAVSLSEARAKAVEGRKLLAAGLDPLDERNRQNASKAAAAVRATSFEQCAEDYIASQERGWANPKHRQQWRNTLKTYVYPVFGARAVSDVTTECVLNAIAPIWNEKTETASRVRGRIEAILDYAKSRDLRIGENPARWRGHLSHSLPHKGKVTRVEHHPAIPYANLPAFMAALRERRGNAALALQFVTLTAARSSEARLATWREIDVERGIWTVPAVRMKGRREHRVPLCPPALALLRHIHPLSDSPESLVFPGQLSRPMSDMSLTAVLRRMRQDFTVHGMRSAFRDWAGEETSFAREVAEAALAHVVGDKAEQAYRRGDALEKRRALMESWGSFLMAPKPAAVISFQKVGTS